MLNRPCSKILYWWQQYAAVSISTCCCPTITCWTGPVLRYCICCSCLRQYPYPRAACPTITRWTGPVVRYCICCSCLRQYPYPRAACPTAYAWPTPPQPSPAWWPPTLPYTTSVQKRPPGWVSTVVCNSVFMNANSLLESLNCILGCKSNTPWERSKTINDNEVFDTSWGFSITSV
jgi:hypothetical protein